jgi:dolichol-phosphate mannosyltransferase
LPSLVSALFLLPLPDLHLLIVDDNSPDGTGAIADELCQKYEGRIQVIHRAGKLGLGSAYIAGFKHALNHGAEAVGQMDADFSHPVAKLVELACELERYDVVLGSRYVAGGQLDERWPAWRRGLSAFGNIYARSILRLPVRDCTGGFRLWRRETLLGMPLDRIRSNGYIFQVEMAYVAHRLGHSYLEVPIYFADRKWGESKMNLRIQAEAAVRVLRLIGAYRDLHNNGQKQFPAAATPKK